MTGHHGYFEKIDDLKRDVLRRVSDHEGDGYKFTAGRELIDQLFAEMK